METLSRAPAEEPLRVLVVEDMDNEREALMRTLRTQGFEASGAPDGERALADAVADPPDLVILDLNLGAGMRGDEVLTRLKQKVPGAEVIMLTATGTKEDIFQSGRAGAYAYLEKPAGRALWQMLHLAGQHVRLRQQSRALELGVGPDAIVGQSPALRHVLAEVVERGTARRLAGAFSEPDGTPVIAGGKTGSGDNRFKTFNRRGGLTSSRAVNRTATFAFYVGDRYFGVITAFVPGEEAQGYTFTSALPVSILRLLAPAIDARLQESPFAVAKK